MIYVSTRGSDSKLNFQQTIMAGLANDGGLYMPKSFPQFSSTEINAMAKQSYQQIAFEILTPFIGDEIPTTQLKKIIHDTCQTFTEPTITPIKELKDNQYLLELYHGPTLAFKDLAMQLLARLVDYFLQQSGETINVLTATSGDTGAAAAHAFANKKNCQLFILYPNGKVSNVQESQMTNTGHNNIFPLAIAGNFDDCQNLVKQLFAHQQQLKLFAVNSINWGRIMAQIVYYFYAASRVNNEPINFCVPTGNFGDIFAGYCAKQMGLNIDKLIIATNSNDILHRTLTTGRYEKQATVATISPSMDIQISSNFERLLWRASNGDSNYINKIMASLNSNGYFELGEQAQNYINKHFLAGSASEEQTKATIKQYNEQHNYLPDPHTAVALHVANSFENKIPQVVLATAHPAKFPQAVKQATGIEPALPEKIKLSATKVKYQLTNDVAEVKQFLQNSHAKQKIND